MKNLKSDGKILSTEELKTYADIYKEYYQSHIKEMEKEYEALYGIKNRTMFYGKLSTA